MQTWGPWITRWGHVSLLLDDGKTYISFYPSKFNLLNPNGAVDPVFPDFLAADIINKNDGKPDIVIHLDNLDEAKIKAWWDNYKKTNPKFRGLTNNCSTVMANALGAGGAYKHLPEFTHVSPWSPDEILELARELVLAGPGVYISPMPHSWNK